MRISRNTTDSCSMKSRNTKEKRSRKPLNEWSVSKNPNKGILRPRMRGRKRKRQSGREFGPKKVRILRDCLFPACQGLKIGINRQPFQFLMASPALPAWRSPPEILHSGFGIQDFSFHLSVFMARTLFWYSPVKVTSRPNQEGGTKERAASSEENSTSARISPS